MIYLSSFKLSNQKLKNPNIYPYSVFIINTLNPFLLHLLLFSMEIMVVENLLF